MKYMIMMFGSQRDIDMLTGKSTDRPAWSAEDVGKLHAFMGSWSQALVESGELVDGHGLSAPVHARRIQVREGLPVVTDGPYAETKEIIGGLAILECENLDDAIEVAAKVPLATRGSVELRPIIEH